MYIREDQIRVKMARVEGAQSLTADSWVDFLFVR